MKACFYKRIFPALASAALLLHFLPVQCAATDAFLPGAAMSLPRALHSATVLTNGKVLVAGGVSTNASGSFIGLTNAEVFNPAANSWTTVGSMAKPRQQFSATLLADGKVLVAGGYDRNAGAYLKDSEIFDPTSSNWTATASMLTNRDDHTAVMLTNGLVLVVGGQVNDFVLARTVELYDPATGTWTRTNGPATPRYSASVTLLADGRVLLAGGQNSNFTAVATAELFDPATRTWSATGTMNTNHSGHRATLLADGRVLVSGGGTTSGGNRAELYDPTTGTWTYTGSLNIGRGGHGSVLLTDGTVLVAGGSSNNILASAEIFNPTNETWAIANGLSQARVNHTTTLLADGRALVAGGFDLVRIFSGTEIYGTVQPPQITVQPTNQTVIGGATVVFAVTTTGPQVNYQWRKDGSPLTNGVNLTGATASTLTLSNVTMASAGAYSVVVTNLGGSVTSSNAVLTVLITPPEITVQPTNYVSVVTAPAKFTVTATGATPLIYQWQKDGNPLTNGANLSGANTPSLVISNTAFADAGIYSVVITNAGGSATSTGAVLSVVHLVPDQNLREACYEALVTVGILPPPAPSSGNYHLDFYIAYTHAGTTTNYLNAADLACFTALGINFYIGPTNLDLEGMQYATNMENFVLYASVTGNSLANLRQLSGMTHLTQLTLNNFLPPDLNALTNLTQLQTLQLESDGLTNAASLAVLLNVTNLDLNFNLLTDLDFAAGMGGLRTLKASANLIEDVSPLLGLTNLTQLELASDPLTNTMALGALTNLTSLIVSFDGLTDISFVTNLIRLQNLDVGFNPLADPNSLNFIAGLTNLTQLLVAVDGVTNLAALVGLKQLTQLGLQGNQLADLTPLTGLTNLVQLDVSYNLISNLAPITGMKSLYSLYLNNNLITDITPLAGLTNSLRYLFLQGNRLQDISALTNLTGLFYVDLRNNYLDTASNSPAMQTVQYLQAYGVTVDFAPQNVLSPTLSAPAWSNGAFSFTLTGQSGAAFQIQFSTNLLTWLPLQNVTNLNGTLQLSNLPAIGPVGFFRLLGL